MSNSQLRPADLRPYVEAGFTLLPLHAWNGKTTLPNGKVIEDGKRPKHANWVTKPYENAKQVEHMKQGFNVGVRLSSSQLVVDVDPRNMPDFEDTFKKLCDAVGIDPDDFPQVRTGSGGLHLYMTKPEDIAVLDSLEGYDGVEFKTRGRQVVAAGSKHPNGKLYSWDPFCPPLKDLPDAPEHLINLIRRPARITGQNAEGGEYEPAQIAEMLEALPVEEFKDHGKWLQIMQACHHASRGEAREEFIAWSIMDPDYGDDKWIIGRRWDSLHSEGKDGKAVTYRTLNKFLIDYDAEELIPRPTAEDDFKSIGESDLPGDDDFKVPEHEKTGPMTRLNKEYCAVDDSGKFRVYYEIDDPSEGRKRWQNMDRTSFENFLMHRKIQKPTPDGKWTVSPLSKEWLSWAKRRTAKGVVFDPERDHPGFLNLWTGWAVEPKPGKWDYLYELICANLCDGDVEAYTFVLNWLAYMVQKPWIPPEVALGFHGNKGTGKSTLGRMLTALAGRHGRHISSSEHITGRFNSHLLDVVFLFSDEAVGPTDREAQSRLKAMITENMLQYEAKGKDLRSGMNRLHIMLASNDDWFVPMGVTDGERRFFVSRVNDKKRGKLDFFKKLHLQMLEEGGLSAMLHDLQLRDLGEWTPRGTIPATAAFVEQKLRNMNPVAQWWFEKLDSENLGVEICDRDGAWDGPRGVRCFHQDVKDDFRDWCQRAQIKPWSSNRGIDRYFSQNLKDVCPNMTLDVRIFIPDDRKIDIVPAGNSGRARAYKFPPLARCRIDFEEAIDGLVWSRRRVTEDMSFLD